MRARLDSPTGLFLGIVVLGLGFSPVSPPSLTRRISAAETPFTLTGARTLLPNGRLERGLALVVAGGRIERLARASEEGLPHAIRLPSDAVVSPGLIDVGSSLGCRGRNFTTVSAIDAGASARDAVDPHHGDLRIALESGITAAMVCPSPTNVVCGTAVTFRTLPSDRGLDVLRDDAPLVFSLRASVLSRDREPTARGGARHLLLRTIERARAGQAHPRLRSFVEGNTPGLVFCDAEPEVRMALELLGGIRAPLDFVYGNDAPLPRTAAFAREINERKGRVVIGALDFRAKERLLRMGGLLEQAGLDVAFRGAPSPASRDSLRVTAALAVRHGMSPPAARRALTAVAAEVAGVADRIGSLAEKKEADVVVFSGDPLRLDSRVLEVYVRGTRVYRQDDA